MKVGIIILNAMFLLLLVSVLITEWGEAAGIVSGIAIANTLVNSIFIFLKVENDFKRQD